MKISIEKLCLNQIENGIELAVENKNGDSRQPGRVWLTEKGITIGPGRTDPKNCPTISWDTFLALGRKFKGEGKDVLDTTVRLALQIETAS